MERVREEVEGSGEAEEGLAAAPISWHFRVPQCSSGRNGLPYYLAYRLIQTHSPHPAKSCIERAQFTRIPDEDVVVHGKCERVIHWYCTIYTTHVHA